MNLSEKGTVALGDRVQAASVPLGLQIAKHQPKCY